MILEYVLPCLILLLAAALLGAGYLFGVRAGVYIAVKADLARKGALDYDIPDAWADYYKDVENALSGGKADDVWAARKWCAEQGLPYNADTETLFRNPDYLPETKPPAYRRQPDA